jgi:hypothetical protein
MASYGLRASRHTMGFINDDQIPACAGQVENAVLVEGVDTFLTPAFATVQRLDAVHAANHPVMAPPDIFFLGDLAIGIKLTRIKVPEVLTESITHFDNPLRDQAFGSHHQHPLHQTTQLQFPHSQTGLDGFAQPNLIRQQVAHLAGIADHLAQSTNLMRQRDDG